MMKLGEMLTKHRNLFLLILLVATLLVSGIANREWLEAASATVDIPVTEVSAQPAGAVESYRQQRDAQAKSDMDALQALCDQTQLDTKTREDAAARLQSIVECRQAQSALEGALLGSSLHPCVAVVSDGIVTIVTGKSTVTEKDTALVLTLAAAHANAAPEDVRIITAK